MKRTVAALVGAGLVVAWTADVAAVPGASGGSSLGTTRGLVTSTVPASATSTTSTTLLSVGSTTSTGAAGQPSGGGSVQAASKAPAPSTNTGPVPNGSNCGGQPTLVADGLTWACSFDSEFTGSTLDPTKWQVVTTAQSGFVTGPNPCYVNSPNNVSVGQGYLSLTVREEAQPFMCAGTYPMQYTSGYVATYQRFSQTDGRFEVLAKVPDATVAGLESSFWMYPESLNGYGAWPQSGEIDIAETYSVAPTLAVPYIHYSYDSSTTDASTNTNTVTATNCPMAPGQFNDYVLEWTPSVMKVFINGKLCLTDHWVPSSPLVAPQPFDQPFFVNLTQALGNGNDAFNPATTPIPATTEIKYVRVWKLQ
jgi:beta-glucanase (GH16 family)